MSYPYSKPNGEPPGAEAPNAKPAEFTRKPDRKQVLFSVPNPETGLPAFEVTLKNGHPKLSFFGREGDTVFSVETEETDGEAEGIHLQLSDHKGNVRISSYAGETGGDLLLFSRGPKGRDDIAASLQTRDGEGYLSVKPVAEVNYAIRIGREE